MASTGPSTVSTLGLASKPQDLGRLILQESIAEDQKGTISTLRTPIVGAQILTPSTKITTNSRDQPPRASTTSTPTDLSSLSALASEITIQASALTKRGTDLTARAKLVAAAEKIILSARSPGENAYFTGAQVRFVLASTCLSKADFGL